MHVAGSSLSPGDPFGIRNLLPISPPRARRFLNHGMSAPILSDSLFVPQSSDFLPVLSPTTEDITSATILPTSGTLLPPAAPPAAAVVTLPVLPPATIPPTSSTLLPPSTPPDSAAVTLPVLPPASVTSGLTIGSADEGDRTILQEALAPPSLSSGEMDKGDEVRRSRSGRVILPATRNAVANSIGKENAPSRLQKRAMEDDTATSKRRRA